MPELERAVDVLGYEDPLHRDFLRPVHLDQLDDAYLDDSQPLGERSAGGGDAALGDDAHLAALAVDDSETRAQTAGVEPENARGAGRQHARDRRRGSDRTRAKATPG